MRKAILFVAGLGSLVIFSACAAKMTYPPDQATLDACRHDCLEQWKSCRGDTCETDRSTCIERCRDYGGLRGGGHGVAIQVPAR